MRKRRAETRLFLFLFCLCHPGRGEKTDPTARPPALWVLWRREEQHWSECPDSGYLAPVCGKSDDALCGCFGFVWNQIAGRAPFCSFSVFFLRCCFSAILLLRAIAVRHDTQFRRMFFVRVKVDIIHIIRGDSQDLSNLNFIDVFPNLAACGEFGLLNFQLADWAVIGLCVSNSQCRDKC